MNKLSDEEFARWYEAITCPERFGHDCPDSNEDPTEMCIKCFIEWLQAEHKEVVLPCPFCGHEARAIRGDEIMPTFETTTPDYAVCCPVSKGGCGATGRFEPTEEAAIKGWNRRTK